MAFRTASRRAAMTAGLLAALLGGPAPSPARADDAVEARAKELYQNGAILYDEGRYEDAIKAWQEAYRLSDRPLLLFNIANAQERVGQWRDALETLNRYRAYAPADERETLDRRIQNLEWRISEQTGPAAPPAPVVETNPPPIESGVTESAGVRWLPVSLWVTGGVGLGTGAAFAFRAVGAREEAIGGCADAGGGLYICSSDAAAALNRDRASSIIADSGFAIGALALTGGVVVGIMGRSVSVSSLGVPAPRGVRVQGTF